ncbi:MAG: D-alanyl-D-alanine carboxypeptidase [Balneolaceae bacterium]
MKWKSDILPIIAVGLLLYSCSAPRPATDPEPVQTESTIQQKLSNLFSGSTVFSSSQAGFLLYDPEQGKTLFDLNGNRFFTPASNIKIFTLYASLKTLPDTLPSIRYAIEGDTLYFRGTGEPSFLNSWSNRRDLYNFLSGREEILAYDDRHFTDQPYGPGWSWDWYSQPYAVEKSPFPIYGNIVRFYAQQVALVILDENRPVDPPHFENYLEQLPWNGEQVALVDRDREGNRFTYSPRADTARQVRQIPFRYDRNLMVSLLSDTLGREVHLAGDQAPALNLSLAITPAEELYRRMMLQSDNLVAEQLMLMIAEQELGQMHVQSAIQWSMNRHFSELSDGVVWEDGSGLTRYNLVTPAAVTGILERLITEFGQNRILSLFPAGGQSGTLGNFFHPPAGQPPYVYGKTGTLRNNTALSGYLRTESGRLLLFSFFVNNFTQGSGTVRSEMERVLNLVRTGF